MKLEPESQSSPLSDYTFWQPTPITGLNIKQEPVSDEEDNCPYYGSRGYLGAFNDYTPHYPLQDTENPLENEQHLQVSGENFIPPSSSTDQERPVPPTMLIDDHQDSDTFGGLALNLRDFLPNTEGEYTEEQISSAAFAAYDAIINARTLPRLSDYFLWEESNTVARPSETRADTGASTVVVNDENSPQVKEDTH